MNSGAIKAAADAAAEFVSETRQLSSFRIMRFGRHQKGYFHAEVKVNGSPKVYVSCEWGSWLVPIEPGSPTGKELLSPYRDVLASKALEFKGRERKARQQQKEDAVLRSNDPQEAVRVLTSLGYPEDEIAGAVSTQFGVKHADVCGMVQQQLTTNTTSREG